MRARKAWRGSKRLAKALRSPGILDRMGMAVNTSGSRSRVTLGLDHGAQRLAQHIGHHLVRCVCPPGDRPEAVAGCLKGAITRLTSSSNRATILGGTRSRSLETLTKLEWGRRRRYRCDVQRPNHGRGTWPQNCVGVKNFGGHRHYHRPLGWFVDCLAGLCNNSQHCEGWWRSTGRSPPSLSVWPSVGGVAGSNSS